MRLVDRRFACEHSFKIMEMMWFECLYLCFLGFLFTGLLVLLALGPYDQANRNHSDLAPEWTLLGRILAD